MVTSNKIKEGLVALKLLVSLSEQMRPKKENLGGRETKKSFYEGEQNQV
jgi:hypothetical protein